MHLILKSQLNSITKLYRQHDNSSIKNVARQTARQRGRRTDVRQGGWVWLICIKLINNSRRRTLCWECFNRVRLSHGQTDNLQRIKDSRIQGLHGLMDSRQMIATQPTKW